MKDPAMRCFTHGLAHLIDEYGYDQGLARAGHLVLWLMDRGPEENPESHRGRPPAPDEARPPRGRVFRRPPRDPRFQPERNGHSKGYQQGGLMADVTASVEVDVPVRVAYNQWTQFEEFPRFMEGVEEVRQLDDATLSWKARIAGVERQWQARIVEQEPERVIAWTSTEGTKNRGRVTFEPIDTERTRIDLTIDMEPEGMAESAADAMGIIERRAEGDLERFKEFIEDRGRETGAWRGEIHGGEMESGGVSGRGGLTSTGETGAGGVLREPDEPAIPTGDDVGIGRPRGEMPDAFTPAAPHYADDLEEEDPGAEEQRRR